MRSLAIPSEEDDGKSVSSQGGVEKVLERLDRRLAAIERELDLEREVVHEALGKRRPLPASPPAAKAALAQCRHALMPWRWAASRIWSLEALRKMSWRISLSESIHSKMARRP